MWLALAAGRLKDVEECDWREDAFERYRGHVPHAAWISVEDKPSVAVPLERRAVVRSDPHGAVFGGGRRDRRTEPEAFRRVADGLPHAACVVTLIDRLMHRASSSLFGHLRLRTSRS